MNVCEREGHAAGLAVLERHLVVLDAEQFAAQLAVVADRLLERDVRLVSGPVGEVLRAGQRPVDAGGADFELVRASISSSPASSSASIRSEMRRDRATHCSTTSCPVAGSSAMICSVRSPSPLQSRSRTSSRARDRSRGPSPRVRSLASGARYRPCILRLGDTGWQSGSGPAPEAPAPDFVTNVGIDGQIGAG